MDIDEVIRRDGHLRPARIELRESSGPVSPRFQYFIELVLEAADDVVMRKGRRKSGSGPEESLDGEVPSDRWEQLWRDILAQDVLREPADRASGEINSQSVMKSVGDGSFQKRVGVSFNFVEVKLGGEQVVRFDYLLPQLDEGEYEAFRALVGLVKQLAD